MIVKSDDTATWIGLESTREYLLFTVAEEAISEEIIATAACWAL